MPQFGHESQNVPVLAARDQELKALFLRAAGARPRCCEYCASTVQVGQTRCPGCGAAVTSASREITDGDAGQRNWALPLLLCFFFPPAIFVIGPMMFWRWLRIHQRGWVVPLLICLVFPPAALLVAPAILWPSGKGTKAA